MATPLNFVIFLVCVPSVLLSVIVNKLFDKEKSLNQPVRLRHQELHQRHVFPPGVHDYMGLSR